MDHIFGTFTRSLSSKFQSNTNLSPKERMADMIKAYVHHAKSQPALHKVMIQEASYSSPRLDWLIERHLKQFFQATFGLLTELQALGVAPQGNPALLFNMIRLSSGGLLALGNELKASSDIDIDAPETLDEIAQLIINVFLPGDMPKNWAPAAND